jgi:hypothetical protein
MHLQPEPQVLAKAALGHAAGQVDVRRAHHADVGLAHGGLADAPVLALLEEAQQTRLRRAG